MKKVFDKKPPQQLPAGAPQSFDDFYKMCKSVMIHGTKEQTDKLWKVMQKGKGDWVWARVGLIAEAYDGADAKGKEEFCLMAIERHLKSGNAKLLKEVFIDPETGIKHRQYKFTNGLLYRVPYATEGMDKSTYQTALNKKFVGDFIERHTSGSDTVTLIPLDTPDKVQSYNKGEFYDKYVYKRKPKHSPK